MNHIQLRFHWLAFVYFLMFTSSSNAHPIIKIEDVHKQIVINDPIQGTLHLSFLHEYSLLGKDGTVLVTVHKLNSQKAISFTRLTFWKILSNGYSSIESFDALENVELFPFVVNGQSFLFVDLLDPSAGAVWARSAVYYVNDIGNLSIVTLQNQRACEIEFPPLSLKDKDATVRGGFYYPGLKSLYFRTNIWKESDSPNFPSGGQIAGKLELVRTDKGEYEAKVIDCQRIENMEESNQ
jgi:hypothetical protein